MKGDALWVRSVALALTQSDSLRLPQTGKGDSRARRATVGTSRDGAGARWPGPSLAWGLLRDSRAEMPPMSTSIITRCTCGRQQAEALS